MIHTTARRGLSGLLAAAALVVAPATAPAWEATTTHPGLTEQAALAAGLHERLGAMFGLDGGLFEPLTVPPADAPELFEVLRRLSPAHGYVPDGRGRLSALGWLSAGSVIADVPAAHAAHHFFDPTTGQGLTDATFRGIGRRLRHALLSRAEREAIVRRGVAAPDWVVDERNPMNLDRFWDQFDKAVRARTPAERERHLAAALLAAGAILHVLQDMGSPSHVRNDLAAHLGQVGNDASDLGSRFERIAALAYGRLSVPAPSAPISAADLRSFFSSEDGTGLADWTAARWFSAHTLPRTIELTPQLSEAAVARRLAASLRRPSPAPPATLDLRAAARPGGARLTDEAGTCVARFRLDGVRLQWLSDDECMLEQIAAILPVVAAYSAGLLEWLYRGRLELSVEGNRVAVRSAVGLGAGTLELFWDDGSGVRAALGDAASVPGAGAGAPLGGATRPPRGARRVTALFSGVDADGQPLLAAGSLAYPPAAD